MEAAGRNAETNNWQIRIIALVACFSACLLHSVWRLGGIYLKNIFATFKIAMLVMMIITGFLSWGGIFPRAPNAAQNLSPQDAFNNTSKDAYSYAEAYLAIAFAFGGFNQANYVSQAINGVDVKILILTERRC